MKVYLDDERTEPKGWTRTYTPRQTITLLEGCNVTEISLDHDLGLDDSRTGYTVLLWVESRCAKDPKFVPPFVSIHTANAGARRKMVQGAANVNQIRKERLVKCRK